MVRPVSSASWVSGPQAPDEGVPSVWAMSKTVTRRKPVRRSGRVGWDDLASAAVLLADSTLTTIGVVIGTVAGLLGIAGAAAGLVYAYRAEKRAQAAEVRAALADRRAEAAEARAVERADNERARRRQQEEAAKPHVQAFTEAEMRQVIVERAGFPGGFVLTPNVDHIAIPDFPAWRRLLQSLEDLPTIARRRRRRLVLAWLTVGLLVVSLLSFVVTIVFF